MINKKDNFGKYMQIKPTLPTYHIEEGGLAKVISYWVNEDGDKKKVVFQTADGCCLTEDVTRGFMDFSPLPLHSDTISDDSACEVFSACYEDLERTEIELSNWGITKVYLDPYSNKVTDVHSFLEKVSTMFKDKSLGYFSASLEERAVIFEQ